MQTLHHMKFTNFRPSIVWSPIMLSFPHFLNVFMSTLLPFLISGLPCNDKAPSRDGIVLKTNSSQASGSGHLRVCAIDGLTDLIQAAFGHPASIR